MSPQRRIALVSVAAAVVLIALKLVTGLATGSLGLLSEAAHSGTDLVAALLTLFAVGVAVRPADRSHPYGHGKAEHLAALAEASILVLISLLLAAAAVRRLVDGTSDVDATWYRIEAAPLSCTGRPGRTRARRSPRARFISRATWRARPPSSWACWRRAQATRRAMRSLRSSSPCSSLSPPGA